MANLIKDQAHIVLNYIFLVLLNRYLDVRQEKARHT